MYSYTIHGVGIESEWQLPELGPCRAPKAVPDENPIRIEEGEVAPPGPGLAATREGFLIDGQEAFVELHQVGRFQVSSGRRIRFQPAAGSKPGWVRLFLISGAIGCALHQRGLYPLHATAIETNGGCVAFCGNSGDGKSTLAAALITRGYRLFGDDRLCLQLTTEGKFLAFPGPPTLHIFAEAADQTGLGNKGRASDSWRFGKHVHVLTDRFATAPLPLERLYFLDWDDSVDADIAAMSSLPALMRLRRDVSLIDMVEYLGREAGFLQWAQKLLADVPVYHLRRAKSFDKMEAAMDVITRHIQGTVSSGQGLLT